MQLLEVNQLSKTYGSGDTAVHALKSASFTLQKGEFAAIVGESGSGKSTLLNLIGGLDTPTSGSVIIDGNDIFSLNDKELTVFRPRRPDEKYLDELLHVLGLEERRSHLPSQLSGGQQQRVAIGRALFPRPALILADEPTGNLDSENSREVIRLLKETSQKYSQTILMITHNRAIAQSAERVLRVSDGVLTDLGRCT